MTGGVGVGGGCIGGEGNGDPGGGKGSEKGWKRVGVGVRGGEGGYRRVVALVS